MTHDERIEAMARAIHDAEVSMFDSPRWLRRLEQAKAALAAAGVEEMVRRAADKGFEEGFQCMQYDMQKVADAVDAIVREVMGRSNE
jgi:hypothetical protein